MMFTATYSPEDNKLRLYATSRLDAETYAKVKAAGFRWAPKQELFVAPSWTPDREDLLTEMAGEVGDEDTSLVERAEAKAERLENLSERKAAEGTSVRASVDRLADGIPLGQPILVGHHSEKRARKDAEKITSGMRKAIGCFEAAGYWADRAAGAVAAAKYKERPEVRARRIKKLESELRGIERNQQRSVKFLTAWNAIQEGDNQAHAKALHVANYSHITRRFSLADYPRQPPASQYEGDMGLWSALEGGVITWQQAKGISVSAHETWAPVRDRWIAHFQNRLAYERAMLEEAGGSDLLKPKPRRALAPMMNYRAAGGSITTENQWDRGRDITYPQVEMTKAEYAAINKDYRGSRVSRDRQYRFRSAMIKHALVCVFLTDSKEHPQPADGPAPAPAPRPVRTPAAPYEPTAAEKAAKEMRTALKAGVTVAVAPQLFPTPQALAEKMVSYARIEPGDHVLEPSAGTGALLDPLYNGEGTSCAVGTGRLVAVEVNQTLADNLRRTYVSADVIHGDFLECTPDKLGTFNVVLMNPPFVQGADIKHIEHARRFLKPGGRLVAICANGPRQRAALMDEAEHWEDLPAGTFAGSGTGVNTALLVMRPLDVCATKTYISAGDSPT